MDGEFNKGGVVMLKVKKKLKRIFRAREIAVNRKGKSGLSKAEISEVLSAIRSARRKGLLPDLTLVYNPHPDFLGKDPIYLKPKSADLKRTAVKVRAIIRTKFADKYDIYLV